MTVVIIGASSGPGRLLFERLSVEGVPVTGVARNRRDFEDTATAKFLEIDANDITALANLVDETTTLIHCSRPELLTQFLLTKPNLGRIIALGSTRIYTRFPDDKCDRLADMSHAIWMGDIPAVLLHPTMIYGAPGLNNIERVVKVARRFPWIPLPEEGKALIQPVSADDVVRAVMACLEDTTTNGRTIVLAGNSPVSYRQFVEQCIDLATAKCRVVSMPYPLLSLMAVFTHIVPGIPVITQDEIRRLLENKNFSTTDMVELLNVEPVELEAGLKKALG